MLSYVAPDRAERGRGKIPKAQWNKIRLIAQFLRSSPDRGAGTQAPLSTYSLDGLDIFHGIVTRKTGGIRIESS